MIEGLFMIRNIFYIGYCNHPLNQFDNTLYYDNFFNVKKL